MKPGAAVIALPGVCVVERGAFDTKFWTATREAPR